MCLPAGTHSPVVIIINSILIFFEVVQLHSVHRHAAAYAIPRIINTQGQGTHVTVQGVYLVSGVHVATLQGVYSGVMMMRMPGVRGRADSCTVPLWTRRRIHGTQSTHSV